MSNKRTRAAETPKVDDINPTLAAEHRTEGRWTPEPWKVGSMRDDGVVVESEHWWHVASVHGQRDPGPLAPQQHGYALANASRICECVNALAPGGPVAKLVEAAWDTVTDVERHMPAGPVADRIALRLRAALAAVRPLLKEN